MRLGPIFLAVSASLATVVALPLADGSADVAAGNLSTRDVNAGLQSYVSDGLQRVQTSLDTVLSNITTTDPATFAKQVVQQIVQNNPKYNFAICRVSYFESFNGKRDVDWGVLSIKSLGYTWDLVVGGVGEFSKFGGGGDDVWAYKGKVTKVIPLRRKGTYTVVFGQP